VGEFTNLARARADRELIDRFDFEVERLKASPSAPDATASTGFLADMAAVATRR